MFQGVDQALGLKSKRYNRLNSHAPIKLIRSRSSYLWLLHFLNQSRSSQELTALYNLLQTSKEPLQIELCSMASQI